MTASPEKAAPIPAEVRRQIKKLWAEHGGFQYGPRVEHCAITEDAFWQFMASLFADREARPSLPDRREERIREDERDRLYEEFTSAFTEEVYQIRGAAMWTGEVLRRKGAMFPADRARARQGGNNG